MLIVNINTLCTICKLNFFNKVIINSFFAKDSKNIMRIYSTECKFCTFFNMCTLYDIFAKSCTVRDKIFLFFCCILIINNYMATLLDFFKSNITFDFGKNSKLLWLSCFKSSSTRGRPCVISAPPATPPVWNVLIVSCVPGSPIDCLCDNTNSLTNLNRLVKCKVCTIALAANTVA